MRRQICWIAILFALAIDANAVPGSLDSSFGTGGLVAQQGRIALQPNGRIVVARTNGEFFEIVRLLSDGSSDLDFGLSGVATIAPPDLKNSNAVRGISLDAQGSLLVAGHTSVGTGGGEVVFSVLRVLPDGTPDPSFGDDGWVTTDIASVWLTASGDIKLSVAQAAKTLPDGKVLATGFAYLDNGNRQLALVRYLADGSLDTSFGGKGVIVTSLSQDYTTGTDLHVLPDGRFLVAGHAGDEGSRYIDFVVCRYMPSGALDSSFGSGGVTRLTVVEGQAFVSAMVVAPDGRIAVAGNAEDYDSRIYYSVLARFTPSGALDTSFGSAGMALKAVGIRDSAEFGGKGAFSVALQQNGKLVVGGSAELDQEGSSDRSFVFRYLPNGDPDPTFGDSGALFSLYPQQDYAVDSLAIQPDGMILAGGSALARLQGDPVAGQPPTTPSPGGVASGGGSTGFLRFAWLLLVLRLYLVRKHREN